MSDEHKKPTNKPRSNKRRSKSTEPLDLLAALEEPVTVRQNGKTEKASPFEVGFLKQVVRAVAGNVSSIRYVLGHAKKHGLIRQQERHRSVIVIPKDMPDEFQDQIFDYHLDENGDPLDGQSAMQLIFRVIADWLDWRKSQNKETDNE